MVQLFKPRIVNLRNGTYCYLEPVPEVEEFHGLRFSEIKTTMEELKGWVSHAEEEQAMIKMAIKFSNQKAEVRARFERIKRFAKTGKN
jgi:hypothetical protein